MTKLICSTVIAASMFFAQAAEARNSWDAFAGGLANGLSGQQLYTPPAPAAPEYRITSPAGPNNPYATVTSSDGRRITVDTRTGYWSDSHGNFGYIQKGP